MLVFFTTLLRRNYLTLAILLVAMSCTSNGNEEVENISFFRDKIINQRIMLEDAMKQLEYEKTQVALLKQQVELTQQTASNKQATAVLVANERRREDPKSALEPVPAATEDFEKMKAELDLWKSRLHKQESKYKQVQVQLNEVLDFLKNNNVTVLKDKWGKYEKLVLPTLPTASKSDVDASASKFKVVYDSLVTVLNSERGWSKDKINQLERTVANYAKETAKWKKKFNQSGTYLAEHNANFIVNLKADSSTQNKILFDVILSRESSKLKSGSVDVNIACRLPNGNLVNTYTGKVEYGKNEPHTTIRNVQPFVIETTGWYEVIVYLDNKESYYEDIYFTKK